MKLGLPKTKIDSKGDFETQQFDFGDKRVIMEILRGKMYSDPIYTICQEITSNARDAHREVKQGGKPIVVKFPAELDDSFYIQDFGPGISPSRMSDVFIKYGSSTKRDNNRETGGFGLGAKTPFAYSDMFNIVTVTEEDHKHIRREYIAYIDETRIGAISLTKTEETTDPTGTKIILRAKKDDAGEFEEGILKSCYFWKTRPKLYPEIDYEWPKPEYAYTSKSGKWAIESESSYSADEILAIVDGIQYPLKNLVVPDKYRSLLKSRIRMFFRVGEVKVTANREAIEVSDKTKKKIFEILDDVDDEINSYARNKVLACSDIYEAIKEYEKISSAFPIRTFKWNGCELKDSIHHNNARKYYLSADDELRTHEVSRIRLDKDIKIFSTDLVGWPKGKKIISYMKENDTELYVIKKSNDMPEILKHIKIRDIKDIPDTKVVNSKIKKLREVNPHINKTYWPESSESLENGSGVYVVLKGTKCHINKRWLSRKDLESLMTTIWQCDENFKLHAVLSQHANKIGPNWSHIDVYILKLIRSLDKQLGDIKEHSHYCMKGDSAFPDWLYEIIRLNRKKFRKTGVCYKYYDISVRNTREISSQAPNTELRWQRNELIRMFFGTRRNEQYTNQLLKPLYKIFFRKYPLLKYLKEGDHFRRERELEDIVINYIIERDRHEGIR